MFAFLIEKNDVKIFMNKLFIQDAFDKLDIREVKLKLLVSFEIDCRRNNDFEEGEKERFVKWGEIRTVISSLIKGDKRPLYMKLVFSLPEDSLLQIDANAASAFINIVYENDRVSGFSGSSQKVFSLDKNVEDAWDNVVKKFLKKNNIPYE